LRHLGAPGAARIFDFFTSQEFANCSPPQNIKLITWARGSPAQPRVNSNGPSHADISFERRVDFKHFFRTTVFARIFSMEVVSSWSDHASLNPETQIQVLLQNPTLYTSAALVVVVFV